MPKEGLPVQGTDAILKAMSEANEAILNQKKKKTEKDDLNDQFRNYVKGK